MSRTVTPPDVGQAQGSLLPYLNPPARPGDRLRCTWSDQAWWTVGRVYVVSPGPNLLDDDGDIRLIGRDSFRGQYAPRFERV